MKRLFSTISIVALLIMGSVTSVAARSPWPPPPSPPPRIVCSINPDRPIRCFVIIIENGEQLTEPNYR